MDDEELVKKDLKKIKLTKENIKQGNSPITCYIF